MPDKLYAFKVNRPLAALNSSVDKEYLYEKGLELDDEGGAHTRFEWERHVLRTLEHLQGSVLPVLFGTYRVPELALPGCAPPLILEHVGTPIYEEGAWPAELSPAERRDSVEAAYATLHGAGWVHGDVAARNVLVSHVGGNDEAPARRPRVCIVDFARAERWTGRDGEDRHLLRKEQRQVVEMLDRLFSGVTEAGRSKTGSEYGRASVAS